MRVQENLDRLGLRATLKTADAAGTTAEAASPATASPADTGWSEPIAYEVGLLDPADWRVSPLYGDPAGLPPMRIFQGDADIVGPDVIEFARKAARAGVDVRLRVEPDGFHVYVLGVPIIPEAEAALDRSARFISGILTQA